MTDSEGRHHVWNRWKIVTADGHPGGLIGRASPAWRCPSCKVVTHDPGKDETCSICTTAAQA